MNKTELIDAVAEAADLTKAESSRAVDAVVAAITKALKDGDAVTLVGFGTFQVRDRAAHRPQPEDRRHHQDRCFEESVVQGWQGPEGCCKLSGSLGCLAQR